MKAVHTLNYNTFVEEIPQHHTNESGMLVDRFDKENTYIVCIRGAIVPSDGTEEQADASVDGAVEDASGPGHTDVGEGVIGMLCIRDTRDFSCDQAIADPEYATAWAEWRTANPKKIFFPERSDLESYVPSFQRPCEIRLLAVRPQYRNGLIARGLFLMAGEYCVRRGYDLAVIKGITRKVSPTWI